MYLFHHLSPNPILKTSSSFQIHEPCCLIDCHYHYYVKTVHLFHTCAIIYLLHYRSPFMSTLSSFHNHISANENSDLCSRFLALSMLYQTKTVIHNLGCGAQQFEEFLLDAHSKILLLSLKLSFLHLLICFWFFLLFYFACSITFGLWSSEQRGCFLTYSPNAADLYFTLQMFWLSDIQKWPVPVCVFYIWLHWHIHW